MSEYTQESLLGRQAEERSLHVAFHALVEVEVHRPRVCMAQDLTQFVNGRHTWKMLRETIGRGVRPLLQGTNLPSTAFATPRLML